MDDMEDIFNFFDVNGDETVNRNEFESIMIVFFTKIKTYRCTRLEIIWFDFVIQMLFSLDQNQIIDYRYFLKYYRFIYNDNLNE